MELDVNKLTYGAVATCFKVLSRNPNRQRLKKTTELRFGVSFPKKRTTHFIICTCNTISASQYNE